jgi:hypothetical protein
VRLEQTAAENGRSLSQEAQLRLQRSFDLPEELLKQWGPPDVKALAQLVSRVTRTVHTSVGASPFHEAGDLAWHRNPFTHAAVSAAITVLLERYKPAGSIQPPPEVMKRASWVGPEEAQTVITPESVGQSCALGLLSQLDHMTPPPRNTPAGARYGERHYVLPDIRDVLEEPKK